MATQRTPDAANPAHGRIAAIIPKLPHERDQSAGESPEAPAPHSTQGRHRPHARDHTQAQRADVGPVDEER